MRWTLLLPSLGPPPAFPFTNRLGFTSLFHSLWQHLLSITPPTFLISTVVLHPEHSQMYEWFPPFVAVKSQMFAFRTDLTMIIQLRQRFKLLFCWLHLPFPCLLEIESFRGKNLSVIDHNLPDNPLLLASLSSLLPFSLSCFWSRPFGSHSDLTTPYFLGH